MALHGDMGQPERTAALEHFRNGEVTLLVASDVAARGLDIPDVSHIYNFDVPHHADDYVHRIGRTGRAGRSGVAITFVSPADSKSIAAIEKLTGQPIPWAGEPADVERRQPREPARAATLARRSRSSTPRRQEQAARQPAGAPGRRKSRASTKRESRRPAAQPRVEEGDDSHLPAFLLTAGARSRPDRRQPTIYSMIFVSGFAVTFAACRTV